MANANPWEIFKLRLPNGIKKLFIMLYGEFKSFYEWDHYKEKAGEDIEKFKDII